MKLPGMVLGEREITLARLPVYASDDIVLRGLNYPCAHFRKQKSNGANELALASSTPSVPTARTAIKASSWPVGGMP